MASSSDEKDGPRVPRLAWDDINAELPPKIFLVRHLGFEAGGGAPHAIIAYGYSGKSMLAQSLALSMAVGGLVWGAFQASMSRVVYVDMEQGENLSRERFQRLARGMNAPDELLRRNLQLVTRKQSLLLQLDPRKYLAEWEELMTGADVLILDSLAAVTHGIDENSNAIRPPLDMLATLSEKTRCRAIFIHHAGKSEQDDKRKTGRGHSSIFDASHSQLVLKKDEDATAGTLSIGKSRSDGRDGEVKYDIADTPDGDLLVTVEGDFGDDGSSRVGEWWRAIGGALVRAPNGLSKRQLAKAAGCSARAIDAVYDSMRGQIEVTSGTVNGQKAQIFRLVGIGVPKAFPEPRDAMQGVSNVIAFPERLKLNEVE